MSAATVWHWRKPYFKLGDRVFVRRMGKHVTVTGLKVNRYGRVSYLTRGERLYLLEDLAPVHVKVTR